MKSHVPVHQGPVLLTGPRKRSIGASRFGRKFVTIVGAGAVLALAACGSGAGTGGSSSSAAPTSSSESPSMEPAGTLRIGVDPSFPPYIFQDSEQYTGSEADIAQALGQKLNMKVEFQKMGFDALIPSLQADRIDMTLVGGWADGEKRRAAMNMVAYFVAYSGLLVKKGDTTSSLAELCGKKVSVLGASVYEPALQDASRKCTDAGKPAINILPLDQEGAILALKSGQADARLDEGGLAGYIAKNDPALQMNPLTDFETFNAAMGVSKEKTELATQVTAAMEELRAEGKLAEIFDKWGLPPDWLLPRVTLNGQ